MRTRLSPTEREHQLTLAGADLAEKIGFLDVNHHGIAKQCGVSTATTFVYFQNVSALRSKLAIQIERASERYPKASVEVALMHRRGLLAEESSCC